MYPTAKSYVCVAMLLAGGVAAGQDAPLAPTAPSTLSNTAPPQKFISVRGGYGTTDNLGRLAVTTGDVSYRTLGTSFYLNKDSRRFHGQLAGDIDYRSYSESIAGQDEDRFGAIEGDLLLDVVPNRFVWTFQQSIGDVRSNPLQVDSILNREFVSVFSTGPDVTIPLNERTAFRAAARFDQRSFDESSEYDSKSRLLSASIVRAVSRAGQVGVQIFENTIDFDDGRPGYKYETALATYTRQLARSTAGVQVGHGTMSVEGAPAESDSVSSEQFNLNWEREVGSRSTLLLSGGREFNDAGGVFRLFHGTANLDGLSGIRSQRSRDVLLTGDPFERSTATARFTTSRPKSLFLFEIGAWDDSYDIGGDLDNDGTRWNARVRRNFAAAWTGTAEVASVNRDFSELGQEEEDRAVRLMLSRSLGRNGAVSLRADRTRREGEGENQFDEHVYSVVVQYLFQ